MENNIKIFGKIGCIFNVWNNNEINDNFDIKDEYLITEKIDGTCCYINNKCVYRRYILPLNENGINKKYQYKKIYNIKNNDEDLEIKNDDNNNIIWDIDNDYKNKPENWYCTHMPNDDKGFKNINGNWIGFLPVLNNGKIDNDKWHKDAILHDFSGFYEIEIIDNKPYKKITYFNELDEKGNTYELIGPKIQNNKYNLEKHYYIKHGTIILQNMNINYDDLKSFLEKNIIEGVVIYCKKSKMKFKLHYNHLKLDKNAYKKYISSIIYNI